MKATLADNRTVVNPVAVTGCTYRQLDTWCRAGILHVPESGSGSARAWPVAELHVAAAIRRLTFAGLTLRLAENVARHVVETGETSYSPSPLLAITVSPGIAHLREEI